MSIQASVAKANKGRNPYDETEEHKEELHASAGPLRMSELGAATASSG